MTMSQQEEANKMIVRRIHDELNKGNLAIVDELYSTDYVSHVGKRNGGLREYNEYLQARRQAFPDWVTSIEDLMAEGDRVMVRISEQGTHKGELRHRSMGHLAPTHKMVDSSRVIIRRIKDGKVLESWIHADHLGMVRQLKGGDQK
jgi:predicted ester cyclase